MLLNSSFLITIVFNYIKRVGGKIFDLVLPGACLHPLICSETYHHQDVGHSGLMSQVLDSTLCCMVSFAKVGEMIGNSKAII